MDKKLGIYIHIPFCASKCSYCDFYSLAGCDHIIDEYQSAILQHIKESQAQLEPYYINTIYFGGGTPSYYGGVRICEILEALKTYGKVLKSAEITVEMNPDSTTFQDLKMLRSHGVNRISMGVQSADDDILKDIGRRHTFEQAKAAVKMVRKAGFKNLSLDLIYGLPHQSSESWVNSLSEIIALKPEHLSCYGLKIEEGTPICKYLNTDVLPDDDMQANMYLYMVDFLADYGYRQYEISNFAIPGRESRHNLKYWKLQDYMSFGAAAHSCVSNLRYSYVSSAKEYIDGIKNGSKIIDEYEHIEELEHAAEYIMLGMRTIGGISKAEYAKMYSSDFDKMEYLLQEYEKKGWTRQINDRWIFTASGFLLSNILIGTLLEAQSQAKIAANPWMQQEAFQENQQEIEG